MKNTMMRSMITLLALSIVCGVAPMSADQPEANLRLQLKNIATTRPAATSPALEAIDARVEAATVQPAAAGLRVTVVLINTGTEPVSLLDPEDLTSVLLLDEEGWPLQVPQDIPRALDDRRRKPDEPRPEPQIVTLAPGKEHRLVISIKEVVPRAKEGEPRRPQPIQPGIYKLKVMTHLTGVVPAGEQAPTRLVSTPDPFTVHLGV